MKEFVVKGFSSKPFSIALLTRSCKYLAAKIKLKGERGSLCLTPLLHLNIYPYTPLRKTTYVSLERILLAHEHHLFLKPLVSLEWKHVPFIKCLFKSRFRAKIPQFQISCSRRTQGSPNVVYHQCNSNDDLCKREDLMVGLTSKYYHLFVLCVHICMPLSKSYQS